MIALTEDVSITSLLNITKNLTINLNGNDIIRTTAATNACAIYMNTPGTTLTLTGDGKVEAYSYAIWVVQGEVIINGGEYKNDDAATGNSQADAAIYVRSEGKVTINGGTFSSAEYGMLIQDSADGTINGGTFNGSVADVKYCCHVDLTVNGGTFTGTLLCEDPCTSTSIVYDGTFTDNR